ncbi:DNA polymerase III subunit chi [Paracoccus sp. p4-l81]|uniref:DNA polymerase III subunit chi n=1 Tax=Paracoccus sp. p4-l81 TaxID=3342806 RepID=UPI0035BA5338
MADALFYHLTGSTLEGLLPVLIGKCRAAGWRVVVRGRDAERMDWLDQKLWLTGDDGDFPAHGLSGGPHDADQPVLLTCDDAVPNGAQALIAVDGATVAPAELAGLARALILFDGGDQAAVQHARDQWKTLVAAGVAAQYWAEDAGRWSKRAESGAAEQA